jgi:putative endonuclease
MNFVYVLYSEKDGGLYIGYTSDISRRVSEHNGGDSFSTSYRRPLILAYYEAYFCKEDALRRERFLKSGAGRTFLKKQMRAFFASRPSRPTT